MTQLCLIYLILLLMFGIALAVWIHDWIETRKHSVPSRRFRQMVMQAHIWSAVFTALIISPSIMIRVFGPQFEIGGVSFDFSRPLGAPDRFWGLLGCWLGMFVVFGVFVGSLIVHKELKRCERKEMSSSNRDNCGQENAAGPSD